MDALSEFDKRLNALLKEFEDSISREDMIECLEFYVENPRKEINNFTLVDDTFSEEEKEKYEEEVVEIFQYYIVSDNALHLLQECNELVLYSEKLDCYIWCVDHWGTSWDYVLTSLKLKERE